MLDCVGKAYEQIYASAYEALKIIVLCFAINACVKIQENWITYPKKRPLPPSKCPNLSLRSAIRHQPEVVDLLISFVVSSIHSDRIVLAFPEFIAKIACQDQPASATEDMRAGRSKLLLVEILHTLPSLAAMQSWERDGKLRQRLDSCHIHCWSLLEWIVQGNGVRLRLMAQNEVPPSLSEIGRESEHEGKHEGKRQKKKVWAFEVCKSHDALQQSWSQLYNAVHISNRWWNAILGIPSSFVKFHGSMLGNWHSILHKGLLTSGLPPLGSSGPALWMARGFGTSARYCYPKSYFSCKHKKKERCGKAMIQTLAVTAESLQCYWTKRSLFGPIMACMVNNYIYLFFYN